MSKQQLLVAGEVIADAPVDVLLATAHALAREAADKARAGTTEASREQLIDQVVACQQVQNSVWAAQSVRLAQVAGIEEVVSPGAPPREVRHSIGTYADEWTPQELATRLGWSDRQATNRLTDAVDAIRYAPSMFDLTQRGSLDPCKLTGIADTLCDSDRKAARKIEAELLAAIDDACVNDADSTDGPVALTATKLVRRARRLLAETSPADADKTAAIRRAREKQVRAFPHHEPGLTVFRTVLPTEDAMRIMAGVNELARHLHQDTTTGKSLDECRVDAFVDLLLGNVSVSTTCVVQIPLVSAFDEPVGSGAAARTPGHGSDVAPWRFGRLADVTEHTRAFRSPTTRLSCESGRPASPSFVEPQLEQWIALAVSEGLDVLTTLETPTSQVIVRTPCDAETLIRSKRGTRFAPRIEVDLHPPDSASSQRWDPGPPTRSGDRRRGRPPSAGSPHRGYRIGDVVVEGLGVIRASVLTELCQTLGVGLTRALVDPATGTTLETADVTYRPGARLRRFVMARDQHCRFPGCTRPARLDDIDHVDRWPDGPTAASNLQCLCRHHHRAKHEGGWIVSMTADGVCTWTSPSGRRYLTWPGD